jgi:hypothetical protein
MKRPLTKAFPLFGLIALLASGPHVLAAKLPAPATSEVSEYAGTIESLDLRHGVIVIGDSEYVLSDKLTVNGTSGGVQQKLRKGMHIKFTFSFVKGQLRPVVDEIWLGQ